ARADRALGPHDRAGAASAKQIPSRLRGSESGARKLAHNPRLARAPSDHGAWRARARGGPPLPATRVCLAYALIPDRRTPILPRHLFFQLPREAQQRGFIAVFRGEHHADRQIVARLRQGQRQRGLARHVERWSKSESDALAAVEFLEIVG